MACTATLMGGPSPQGGGLGIMSTWKVLMDTSSLVTGEPVDFTSYYKTIDWLGVGGVNAVADMLYLYGTVLPSDGTDIAAGTVLISVSQTAASPAASQVAKAFAAADGVDLSGVGELRLLAIGTAV